MIALFYELAKVAIAQESTSACSPKNNLRDTKLLTSSRVKLIAPSETMQEKVGTSESVLSLWTNLLK
ncbi:hypothetical protein J1N35_030341 [Gossypium stocksii]|uniref:Uncharacterized protein n=1 Tax=Gossypium stocksii TaxID=47602 RepID=A0A9D3V0R8_9ROSI|nr:hypothetical protein J1N35_030341 [Gossypium stocksii]